LPIYVIFEGFHGILRGDFFLRMSTVFESVAEGLAPGNRKPAGAEQSKSQTGKGQPC
jgi:putative effector of murein hydrolase